jgi:hypothetical protein
MSATTVRTAALRAARIKDSQDKRRRAVVAVQALESAGVPVTAAAVATAAAAGTLLADILSDMQAALDAEEKR